MAQKGSYINSYTKNFLFNINQNIFSFVHIDRTPTRLSIARSRIIIYDINNKNKIISYTSIFTEGKLEFFSKINSFINYYSLVGLQVNFIYILLKEKKLDYYLIHI